MNLNIPEFSVSEFSRSIKRVVEEAFGYVRLKGEISGFKRATSGHLYFSLKDENAVISAVCFRQAASLINFEIADGLQIVASGRITTFEGRSNYQIIVEKIEISGVGAILAMIEKRRQKLLAEGLFDEIHKKSLPFTPRIVGVITSPTGAVIEDIKHRITARFPLHLMIYPSLMQGEKSASEVISGVRFFNQLPKEKRPEVLIIARGGGSFEDLLPFSDESLVREVFKSEIPIISAIGHETDNSLLDYVADLRAPTPTAAAELATPVLTNLKSKLFLLSEKLQLLPQNFLDRNFTNLKNLQRYITDPAKILTQIDGRFSSANEKLTFFWQNFFTKSDEKLRSLTISNWMFFKNFDLAKQKAEFLSNQLNSNSQNWLKEIESNLAILEKFLKSSHYHEVLKRGFALLKNPDGNLIFSIDEAKTKSEVIVEMQDGQLELKPASKQLNFFANQ